MAFRQYAFIYPLLLLFLFIPGVGAASQTQPVKPIKIFVSILPAQYFVEKIGGERVEVETIVQPGQSPATYAPTPKQMSRLAAADLYFTIGVPFENSLIPKLNRTVPGLATVNLQEGINLQTLGATDSHDDHQHKKGELDPHTWLDPALALKQILIIRDTLIRVDPEGHNEYRKNHATFAAQLSDLNESLAQSLAPFAGSTIFVFHPAYGYFCRAYKLKQQAITPEGKDPGARHLARLIEMAKKEQAGVIFVQPQFSGKTAQTIAQAIGAEIVALDPLAYDYISNMEFLRRQITASLSGPGK